ncbi:MAG: SH2 domain-containing protein [Parachlamydiales bacterium]
MEPINGNGGGSPLVPLGLATGLTLLAVANIAHVQRARAPLNVMGSLLFLGSSVQLARGLSPAKGGASEQAAPDWLDLGADVWRSIANHCDAQSSRRLTWSNGQLRKWLIEWSKEDFQTRFSFFQAARTRAVEIDYFLQQGYEEWLVSQKDQFVPSDYCERLGVYLRVHRRIVFEGERLPFPTERGNLALFLERKQTKEELEKWSAETYWAYSSLENWVAVLANKFEYDDGIIAGLVQLSYLSVSESAEKLRQLPYIRYGWTIMLGYGKEAKSELGSWIAKVGTLLAQPKVREHIRSGHISLMQGGGAQVLLAEQPIGTCIARLSSRSPGTLSLSVQLGTNVQHVKCDNLEGLFQRVDLHKRTLHGVSLPGKGQSPKLFPLERVTVAPASQPDLANYKRCEYVQDMVAETG